MNLNRTRYVALLRGINNAGSGPRVAMSDLRALFEDIGFRNVRTLLNSGNVVFSASVGRCAEMLARIHKALVSKLQVTSPVIILSADDVAAAVRGNPFSRMASNPSWLLVVAPVASSGLRQLQPLLREHWAPEALALGARVAYLWCARGIAKSPLWAAVERALNRSGTARNIATVTKLLAVMEERTE